MMDKDPIVFDATMEQRLLNAHQEWLAQQHAIMVQWNQGQDLLIAAHSVISLGLVVVCFVLAQRVNRMENRGNP